MDNRLENIAKKLKLFAMDVDGVLTDGKIYFSESGDHYKAFNSLDGVGVKLLKQANIEVAVITGRTSKTVERRMNELGVTHIYQGQHDKREAYEDLKAILDLKDEEIAYIGDDIPDLPLIRACGLGITVANGSEYVKEHAKWETTRSGGQGAVREACEFILKLRNELTDLCEKNT